jgi:hypothetical protein
VNKFIEIAQVILAFSNKHPYNASMSYSIQNTNTAGLGRSDLRELYLSRLAAQPATGESSAPADGLIETPIHLAAKKASTDMVTIMVKTGCGGKHKK